MSLKIDYLFPWVNPTDLEWQKLFSKARGKEIEPNDPRFRDLGWLKYLLRCLDKNMSWLNRVHIILSSPSQIPKWLNTNEINVIYHEDFIPKDFLPTFNSNAIEMFLANINGLSDYIIYGNDDLFTINPTEPTDFFTDDGTPKIFYKQFSNPKANFFQMCKRCYDLTKKEPQDETYIKQEHINVPLTRDALTTVYFEHKDTLMKSITQFRKNAQNLNQYIYADYLINMNRVIKLDESSHIGKYHGLNDPCSGELTKFLNDAETKTVCINDSGTSNSKVLKEITNWFEIHYPDKSRFEK